jgi:tetratricopeptide (TPR) repeat protein
MRSIAIITFLTLLTTSCLAVDPEPYKIYYATNPFISGSQTADDWVNEGKALVAQGEYDAALLRYDMAIMLDPNNAIAWNEKGIALVEKSRSNDVNTTYYDDAINCFDEAIRLVPDLIYPWCNKGGALDDLGKYDEAIRCLDVAIMLDSSIAVPWNSKGVALAGQGKYDEAILFYDEAIRLDSDYATALANRAIAHAAIAQQHESNISNLGC